MVLAKHPERGSAIIMLFVAVSLFGAIGWVLLQSSRTSTDMIKHEEAKAGDIAGADCTNTISMAVKRLTARGCGIDLISYEHGTTGEGPADGTCAIFHPNGGGVSACGLVGCPLDQLRNIGDRCNGVVYAGNSPDGNRRMYTTAQAGPSLPWNAGNNAFFTSIGTSSSTAGAANTAKIITVDSHSGTAGMQPHMAAQYCADLVFNKRDDWYMPAENELLVMYANRAAIGNLSGAHWSSHQSTSGFGYAVDLSTGSISNTANKSSPRSVRCALKD